jgi:glycosyltransferase involved in cell wall biosynthesis
LASEYLVEHDRFTDRAAAPVRTVAAAASPSRVVHVIGTLDRGGAETVALDLCRALPPSAFEQIFLTLAGREGSLAADFRAAGAAVRQCPLYPRILFVPRLWRSLRSLRPDVVVAHVGLASGFVLMVSRLAGIRARVARIHSEGDGRAGTAGRRLQRFALRQALRWFATDVVAVTRAALKYATAGAADSRFRVLHNGVNLDRFADTDRTAARQALALPAEAPVLVHIGRHGPEKNRPFLGRIHRAAKARNPDARLIVVGPGPHTDVADLVGDPSVLLAGERSDIGRILAAADVLLLPSRREGLPGVVLEALACGVPVVAANLPGLREVRRSMDGLVLLELAAGPDRWAERALQLAAGSAARRDEIRAKFRASPFVLDRVVAKWAHLLRRRPPTVPPALPVALALSLAVMLVLPGLTTAQTFAGQGAVMFIVWVAGIAVLARRSAYGVYASSVFYLLLLGLFHCGLVFSVAWRGTASLNVLQKIWLSQGHTATAVRLSVLGMLAFSVASALAMAAFRPGPSRWSGASAGRLPSPRKAASSGFGAVGLALQLLGLTLVVLGASSAGGFGVFTRGYLNFMRNVDGYRLGWGLLFFGVGTVVGVAAGGWWRRGAWLLFGMLALAGFPLGARGVVLFLFAALLALEARRGLRLRPTMAVVLALGVLLLVGVVRASRMGGLGALRYAPWKVSPLDAIAEMGSSLRPTVVVLGWHAKGEPFRMGATFIAVPLRVIERWTGWHGGPPANDERLFQNELLLRAGPIGGSPVAEGYHNFGTLGVIALLALIGGVVGGLDARPSAPLADALTGVVLIPLLTQVRNGAGALLPQIGIGLAAVAIAWVAQRVLVSTPRWPRASRRAAVVGSS